MEVRSYAAMKLRRLPQQERGERRVTTLLDAAAAVIAETGYDAATMSEIAARAGASIGSLYQFFPNKQSITQALRAQYGREFQELWSPLESTAASLTIEQLVSRLIDDTVQLMERHPALLPLMDAPCSTRNPPIRKLLRQHIARGLRAKKPSLSEVVAARLATVTLQTMRGVRELYREFETRERRALIQEYKLMLVCYLTYQLET